MNAARAAILALLLCWACAALAEIAVPPLTGPVVDQTGTLSGDDVATLTQTLKSFSARKGSQIAVLVVPTTDGEAIEQFSLRVAEAWKIGRKRIDDAPHQRRHRDVGQSQTRSQDWENPAQQQRKQNGSSGFHHGQILLSAISTGPPASG